MLGPAIVLLLVAGLLTTTAQPPPPTPLLSTIEAWFTDARHTTPYSLSPGIAAVVVLPDGTSHTVSSGVQRLPSGPPVDEDTLMEIGSLSKTFTALGLSHLVSAKKLSWDDPVQKWLGSDFALGPVAHVSEALTVRDLLAHRTGLAEGQFDYLGGLVPPATILQRLALVKPVHTLRDVFQYSNTGWMLAGEVLRAATNATHWCAGLHETVLSPLNLTRTFCHRNEIPADIAARHLAAVHKMNPCAERGGSAVNSSHYDGKAAPSARPTSAGAGAGAGTGANADAPQPPALKTYDFVATSDAADDFAWGAADAAGSVISSTSDMAQVLELLLGVEGANTLNSGVDDAFDPTVIAGMLSGQMSVPWEWVKGCGLQPGGGTAPSAGQTVAGHALAAGLGFDLVGDILLNGRRHPYAEKNGDTNMHKARLGLLPADGSAVLLLSNLGGSMGGELTALKFGILTLLAGGTAAEADAAAAAALETTGFWTSQWGPGTTCTVCGRSGASGPCIPGGLVHPPVSPATLAGAYGTTAYGANSVVLGAAGEGNGGGLTITLGPIQGAALTWLGASSMAAVDQPCSAVAKLLLQVGVAPWAAAAVRDRLGAMTGTCSLAEWIVPPEIAAAGVSARNDTVAFPWGCGNIPLPDGPSLYTVAHTAALGAEAAAQGGVLVSVFGEVLWR